MATNRATDDEINGNRHLVGTTYKKLTSSLGEYAWLSGVVINNFAEKTHGTRTLLPVAVVVVVAVLRWSSLLRLSPRPPARQCTEKTKIADKDLSVHLYCFNTDSICYISNLI